MVAYRDGGCPYLAINFPIWTRQEKPSIWPYPASLYPFASTYKRKTSFFFTWSAHRKTNYSFGETLFLKFDANQGAKINEQIKNKSDQKKPP